MSVHDRFIRNWNYVSSHSLIEWAENFLLDLRKSRKNPDSIYLTQGTGINSRVVVIDRTSEKIYIPSVVSAYNLAIKYRVFLLDNEGTLQSNIRTRAESASGSSLVSQNVPGIRHDLKGLLSHGAAPSPIVLKCLRTLCKDPRNVVIITSGDISSFFLHS